MQEKATIAGFVELQHQIHKSELMDCKNTLIIKMKKNGKTGVYADRRDKTAFFSSRCL